MCVCVRWAQTLFCICVWKRLSVWCGVICWHLASLLCPVVLIQLRALLPRFFLTNSQACSCSHSPSTYYTLSMSFFYTTLPSWSDVKFVCVPCVCLISSHFLCTSFGNIFPYVVSPSLSPACFDHSLTNWGCMVSHRGYVSVIITLIQIISTYTSTCYISV